jgi:glycosyltransferase involved in cell wall biosynthesis
MSGTIYVDLRCLQDPAYRWRGIGYHTAALLRYRERSRFSNWQTVGLVDPSMATLLPEFASLVDETTLSVNHYWKGEGGIFLDGSPMTHDTRFSLRVQNQPGVITAAVLYDFIPLDWAGYLPTVASRIEYVAKLARLRKFDLFFPISEYTAWRLSALTGVSHKQISVTGACVRRSLYESRDRLAFMPCSYDRHQPYFTTLGGDDRRKNTEAAVKAVKRLNVLYGRHIPLKVIGHYGESYKFDLLRIAGHPEGDGFLEFYSYVSDEEVVSLHAGAIAAIAPSYIEGFSLPVVEASVCGCPVVVSSCAAQIELVNQPEALFQPDDSTTLADKLQALLDDPSLRASLVASQAHLGPHFHEDMVGNRFWSAIEAAVEDRRGTVLITKPPKPRLAFLSPHPPDSSDTACYTAMAVKAGKRLFHADIYTDTERPLTFGGSAFSAAAAISLAPFLDKRYKGIVSVLGNSSSYARVFEVFERFGGPCILHDVRLTQVYFDRLGPHEFLRFAETLLGRTASMAEVHDWLHDRNPPSLFVERVIRRASPLMVHTATQRALLKKRYGVEAHVLTCCPTVLLENEELTGETIRGTRAGLGIPPEAFLISSFGEGARANEIYTCILALELLRNWNIPAELYFAGNAWPHKNEMDRFSALYGVTNLVHYGDRFSDAKVYRELLIASDAAVQIQPYGFGHPPLDLNNCIGAGLPVVANKDAAESCDAPAYVSTVPDVFSPLQIAEQLALAWETQTARVFRAEARASYLRTHNFEHYAQRLAEILGMP